MDLRMHRERLASGSVFRLIATAWILGAGAIFIPLFAVIIAMDLLSNAPIRMNGQLVHGSARWGLAGTMMILVPLIVAIQGLVIGGIGTFGLWIYQRRKPIRLAGADQP